MEKNNELVVSQYEDMDVFFMEDGWFNATEAAKNFGRDLKEWFKLPSTKTYINELCKMYNENNNFQMGGKSPHLEVCEIIDDFTKTAFVKTRRGNAGGTWLHPRLAVVFARWCDIRFAIWCDIQIDNILRGDHPQFEWKRLRSVAACSFKTMCKLLKLTRDKRGKSTDARHYMNEAKLINWTLTGKYTGLDREKLTIKQLDVLGELETLNGVLIGQGVEYAERKIELVNYMATHLEAKRLFASEMKQIVQ